MTIGPRQSVHRVSHPQRGVCTLVFENGPALLVLEGGVEIPLARARWYGSSSTEGTTYDIRDPEHGDVRVKLVERGTTHSAVWHPQHGPGWWVCPPGALGKLDRLEFDNGLTLPMPWSKLSVGPPGWLKTKEGKKYDSNAEETHWSTFSWGTGMIVLRRGGPPPEGLQFDSNGFVVHPEAPKAAKPRARKPGAPMSRAAALRVAKGWHVEPLSGRWLRYYPGGEKAEARPDEEGRYAGVFTRADGTAEGIVRDMLPKTMSECDRRAGVKQTLAAHPESPA